MLAGYDEEVEKEVIGTMLNHYEDTLIAITDLVEDDFSNLKMKEVFSEIKKIVTISQSLPTPSHIVFSLQKAKTGLLEELLTAQSECVGLDVKYLISLMLSFRDGRKIKKICDKTIIRFSKLQRHEYQVFVKEFNEDIFSNLNTSGQKEAATVSSLALSGTCYNKAVENQQLRNEGKQVFHGIPTYFTDIDNKIYGFSPGHFIVIGGRPGQGKTSFLLNLCANMKESKISIFSLEMPTEELFNKLVLMESEVKYESFAKGMLSHNEITKVYGIEKSIAQRQIVIDDFPLITPGQLYTKLLRIKTLYGLDIAFIDYLQLMRGDDRLYENNQVKIASISHSLKAIAKELNIPIVALAQVNRSSLNKEDKMPQMSDLRESGAIEADADVVLLLHRPSMYVADNDPKRNQTSSNQLMVNIAKNRFGETGVIELYFKLDIGKMYNKFRPVSSAEVERSNDSAFNAFSLKYD